MSEFRRIEVWEVPNEQYFPRTEHQALEHVTSYRELNPSSLSSTWKVSTRRLLGVPGMQRDVQAENEEDVPALLAQPWWCTLLSCALQGGPLRSPEFDSQSVLMLPGMMAHACHHSNLGS